jgi:succinate dehydrogenase / fumarate reductase cytochrome b subunit
MHRLLRFFATSLGRKLVVAITGIALIGFLLGHMLGNMTIYQSSDSLNAYGAALQGHPLVWVVRAGLIRIFGVHVVTAISLALENSGARPTAYTRKEVIAGWAIRKA